MGTTVTFKRPDEQIIQGYLAEPEHAAGAAAIVVIHEWWGVNEQIRGVADRHAQQYGRGNRLLYAGCADAASLMHAP